MAAPPSGFSGTAAAPEDGTDGIVSTSLLLSVSRLLGGELGQMPEGSRNATGGQHGQLATGSRFSAAATICVFHSHPRSPLSMTHTRRTACPRHIYRQHVPRGIVLGRTNLGPICSGILATRLSLERRRWFLASWGEGW